MLAKIGPRREHHLPAAGGRVLVDDVGAGDVRRHQVRRELDAVELQIQDPRQRRDQQRLGQARDADDEAVATDEERQQHELDDVALADNPLLQLVDDLLPPAIHLVREGDIVGRFEIRCLRELHGAVLSVCHAVDDVVDT
jgi:hypothetical protein